MSSNISHDIDCMVNLSQSQSYKDFNSRLSLQRNDESYDLINATIQVFDILSKDIDSSVNLNYNILTNDILSGSVRLVEEYMKDINSSTSLSYSQISKDINGTFTYEPSTYSKDIDSSVNINKVRMTIDLPCYCSMESNDYSHDLNSHTYLDKNDYGYDFNANISVAYRYIKPNDDIIGSCFLMGDSSSSYYQFNGNAKLMRNYMWGDIIYSSITVDPLVLNCEFNGIINVQENSIIRDINGKVKFIVNNYDKYIYSRIKIPKFSINYELQSSINVVNSKSYHIISSITIINPSMCDINTTTTLQEDYISKDISCIANLSNYTTNDINTHATISKVKTIRDINCKLYSIGLREYDIDCNIDVIEYPKPIIEIMKDISCKLTFGDKNITDISCSVILDPIYQFTKDILSNITVTLPNKNIRVGVIVDPYWTYDVFVFKSSLITLLSRTYRHCKLTLVYGGNTRSNSDIITIGKAFKVTNFEYIDFKYSYTDTKYNNLYYNHLIHELFSKPLDRLFIFTNKPSVNYYSPIFKLCTLCMHNNISSVVITSSGEYFELNQNCNFNHHNTDKPIVY